MSGQENVLLAELAPTWSSARRSVMIASVGNILEWYDFTVYGFVAVHLARNFFPGTNETAALLATFAVFGAGFFARPLGAILFGHLADKRGRRIVLLLAMFLMAAGSILIGVLPPFAAIGLAAPALVLLARLAQGLSAGAEFGGAAAFLIEWAPEGRRGFLTSFHQVGTYGGLLVGVAMVAILSSSLSAEDMAAWGWRVPFILGGLLALYAMWMRRTVEETPRFRAERERAVPVTIGAERPTFVLVLLSFGIVALWTVTAFAVLVYMTTYTQRLGGLTPTQALWSTAISAAVAVALIPVFGALSDRLGRKPVYWIGTVAFVVLPIPFYGVIVSKPGPGTILGLQIVLSIFTAMLAGVGPSIISELFATRRRATWVGISSAFSVTIFGGFAPYISQFLVERTGVPTSPAYYIVAVALLTAVTLVLTHETAHRDLR